MDLRDFFDSLFQLDEKIENLENSFIFGNFFEDPQRSNVRPRDLMLKRDPMRSIVGPSNENNNPFQHQMPPQSSFHSESKSFIKEFRGDSKGGFEEKIVIKDSFGNEKIITKHSDGTKTVQREIHKKDNQILEDRQVVSDIGDDIQKLKMDDHKSNIDNGKKDINIIWNFIWPFK